MLRNVTTILAALLIAIAPSARAQSSRPQFEVASVKASKSQVTRLPLPTGSRFSASGVTLRLLLQYAYRPTSTTGPLLNSQVEGAPSWIDTDKFDVEAKAGDDVGRISSDQMQLRLQSLLADRFQLKAHWEMREMPAYNLVIARNGLKIKLSADQTPTTPGGPPPSPDSAAAPPRGSMRVFGKPSPSNQGILVTMAATAIPMSTLLNMLPSYVGRPVIEKAELNGLFDLRLEFVLSGAPPATAGGQPAPPDPGGSSIFTALEEQLGLKLESSKGPVEVLIIDSVQRPTEN
jgi:uncharacterized protein (TIGR03435 family)